jgi:hypothetical protein
MPIHLWTTWSKPKRPNDDKISRRWNDIENDLVSVKTMATSNALVSCVTSPNEKLQLLMMSTYTSVFFFTKANLYYCTNFLSMKHANVLESKNV